jgi:hypothetical protein
VGFFEVVEGLDANGLPVQRLGAEVGRAQNRHVRHRMFAIIDRSVVQNVTSFQTRFTPRNPPANMAGLVPYFSIIE